MDTFDLIPEEAVRHYLQPILLSDADFRFLKSPSTAYSAAELAEVLGGRARFISIDGSHECDDVFWDLRLAEELLCPSGIVAVDDFLNPLALGVNEGVNSFFSTPRALAPFAYIANKLFLCRLSMAEAAMAKVEDLIVNDGIEERSQLWRENAQHGRHRVVARMWGKPFVLLP